MTITAATLTTNLNADLQRSEEAADLAVYIRRAVDTISKLAKWPDLHTSDDTAIVATDTRIADPADIRVLDKITVNDGSTDSEPLERMLWADYKRHTADGNGLTGEPEYYCRHGGWIYLYPTANAAFTVTAGYWKHHGDPADGIEFGDQFLHAVDFGTQAEYLTAKGLQVDPKADQVGARYTAAIALLLHEADHEPGFVKYSDG